MPHDYGLGPGFEPNHVDRKSLYVNLEERIKYLHNFLEWTNGTSLSHMCRLEKNMNCSTTWAIFKFKFIMEY